LATGPPQGPPRDGNGVAAGIALGRRAATPRRLDWLYRSRPQVRLEPVNRDGIRQITELEGEEFGHR